MKCVIRIPSLGAGNCAIRLLLPDGLLSLAAEGYGESRQGTSTTRIDLPLKLLVAEDAEGRVSISYNALASLQARHGLPSEPRRSRPSRRSRHRRRHSGRRQDWVMTRGGDGFEVAGSRAFTPRYEGSPSKERSSKRP